MNTNVADYIAIAILLSVPFEFYAIYKKGFGALFALPKSPTARLLGVTIMLAQLVVSVGVLTVGGSWYQLVPWAALLFSLFIWVRAGHLLASPGH